MGKDKTIRVYDYVNHPYEAVRDALGENPTAHFRDATRSAAARARSVASELRVNLAGIEVGTDISIAVCKVENLEKTVGSPASTRLLLEWEATRLPRLFPFMKAELSLYPLTATETQLDLFGSYNPPMGVLGDAVEALVGHRIAEASVHQFVKDIAAYLRAELSGAP